MLDALWHQLDMLFQLRENTSGLLLVDHMLDILHMLHVRRMPH